MPAPWRVRARTERLRAEIAMSAEAERTERISQLFGICSVAVARTLVVTSVALIVPRQAAGDLPYFRVLDDLPGGPAYSGGSAISADGSTVLLTGTSLDGPQVFRWTSEG